MCFNVQNFRLRLVGHCWEANPNGPVTVATDASGAIVVLSGVIVMTVPQMEMKMIMKDQIWSVGGDIQWRWSMR